jgi:Flp pilus assembly protein CpaB
VFANRRSAAPPFDIRRWQAAAWRWRWPIAVAAIALVARIALPGIVGAFRDTSAVLTLARPVAAGQGLTAEDLRVAKVADKLVPEGALRNPAEVIGRRAAAPLPAGLPLAPELLTDPGHLANAPPGTVVVPVRLSDAAAATVLSPGDRIDVLASAGAGGSGEIAPAQRLAQAALVLDVPGGRAEDGTSTGSDAGLVLLALSEAEAGLVGGAASWSVISAVVVG